jgi:D-arabinose 1-dehydrogenase-like Zn-dependent alcohol dehydrogenase
VKLEMPGITINGGWAEYMVADPGFLIPVPDKVPFEQAAALMCAGNSIYGSIVTANVPKGGSLAIIGIGGLGHIGTQIAKSLGYSVIAVDVKDESLDLAMSFKYKPDICMNPKTDKVEDILNKLGPDTFGYKGVDATILATDSAAAFRTGTDLTKTHGTLVLLGQPAEGITMRYQDTIYRDIKLVGSWGVTPQQGVELMELVQEKQIQIQIKKWRLDQAEEMRQEYLSGKSKGKNVIML